MDAFNPNDYRKRVLADVERRGGIEHSDPFELYDIPLDEADTLTDAEVAARVAEVWGFWQRQRDHPKYRVLVGLLVAGHDTRSQPLLVAGARRMEAATVRESRARRDVGRFEILDNAISRLVERHGGVPAGKVAGLEEIGALGGLSAAEVAARLRRHRVIADSAPAAPVPAVLTAQRRQQIRQLLSEWDRLVNCPPTPTLFALLDIDYAQAERAGEIRLRAEALRARSRELPPGRVRVILDELLIHIQDLVEAGGAPLQEYLRAIIEDVTAALGPKVRAAVLVEDQLVADDFEYLLDEAIDLGLDRATGTRVLTEIATGLGARIEHAPPAPSQQRSAATQPTPAPPSRGWEAPLKAARAALRGGRPREASGHVAEARRHIAPGGDALTHVRPVADEVDRVLAEAQQRWRSANVSCAGKRYVEALGHLEFLQRSASDVPNPDGPALEELLTQARQATAEADRLVGAAPATPADARLRALLAAMELCTDHAGAAAALAAMPVEPPSRLRVERQRDGTVLVTWSPSPTDRPEYKVSRLQPDNSWRVVGRTRATEMEDGGAPTTGPTPVYMVAASVAGRTSDTIRSDETPAAQPESPASQPAPPVTRAASPPAQSTSPAAQPVSPATQPTSSATQPASPAIHSPSAQPTSTAHGQPVPAPPSPASASATVAHPPVTHVASPAVHPTAPVAQPDSSATRSTADSQPVSTSSDPASTAAAQPPTSSSAVQPTVASSAVEPTAIPADRPTTSSAQSASASAEPSSPSQAQGSTTTARPAGQSAAGQSAPTPVQRDEPNPSGMPAAAQLAVRDGLLVFRWPTKLTEVMVVARADEPPSTPGDQQARAWKVTNTRYEIDGGVKIPADLARPCHFAVASCRRDGSGKLVIAEGFAPTARLHWAD